MKSRPPRILVYVVFFLTAIIIIFLISNQVRRDTIAKQTYGAKLDFSYLEQKKPGWDKYLILQQKITTIRQNWSGPQMREYAGEDLTRSGYIRKEYDRQIEEIQRISKEEESLKLSEVHREMQEYARKRSKELEFDYKKKSELVYDSLNQEFQQKEAEMENVVKKYHRDLELEQRQTLVNLNLQLSMIDLSTSQEGTKEEKSRIQAEIDRIKREIIQKVAAKQNLLHGQLIDYQDLRRKQRDSDLYNSKSKLESNFQNDLALYRVKLELEYNDWCERQKQGFTKAIEVRQEQKVN